jgi:hypothetical protein
MAIIDPKQMHEAMMRAREYEWIDDSKYGGLTAGASQQARKDVKFDDNHLMQMLNSRMCWDRDPGKKHFSFLAAHRMGDKVVVFVAHGGKGLVIEDEIGLYPSDALVTQLRLLEAK